ncbi:flagellar biosynthesis regulator FlhF [Clostridium sp. DMHC 10]|uniref:flagellar biosynthesis protein FlhF n=1 Tax=Clostridium sp. DMHC 10 TaxID=747377 RepID=UPI00069D069C|nr:flagellar biosynthesis protein FlhF [Clostridium sp. DMHC 10]KOF55854.1 flagellar biosynthesis regulator FlhF [Clostridium sp. DMHC 10]
MIIKKYIVNDMNEALNKIKLDLGSNAVIISSRKIKKGGIFGFFSKKLIEVTAGVDKSQKYDDYESNIESSSMEESIKALKKAMEKHSSKALLSENNYVRKSPEVPSIQKNSEKEILKEMKEMKELISSLSNEKSHGDSLTDKIKNEFRAMDINDRCIEKMLSDLNGEYDEDSIKKTIKNNISICDIEENGIIALVGPTGVGKTTTIAKLAGRFALIEKKKVGLITVDTYRIGAVEQLKTYADIMGIPFRVVITLKEMDEAIKSMSYCDVILVDTTGRSSKNEMQISELRAFVEKTGTQNISLVISCTTKDKDIEAIVKGYRKLNYKNVIITKLDETTTYGSIINIINYAGKPVSYFTIGQNVPDDIKKLSIEKLSSIILGEDSI